MDNGNNNTSVIKIFIIILIALCFILFHRIHILSLNIPDNDTSKNHMINLQTLGNPVSRFKHDCSVELVYSIDDYQCATLCRGPIKYYSKNGTCVNSLVSHIKELTSTNNCNPKLGVLAYMIGDTQFGTIRLQCLSVDPGVQPDDVYKPNKILLFGSVNINYLEKFPTYMDGVCDEPKHVIVSIPNTRTIRSTGVCVPEEFRKMLKY